RLGTTLLLQLVWVAVRPSSHPSRKPRVSQELLLLHQSAKNPGAFPPRYRFAVWAVPPILDKMSLRAGERFVHSFHFSRLGSRIVSPMHKRRRHFQGAQPPVIQILARPRALGCEFQPDAAIPLYHFPPLLRAMIPTSISCIFSLTSPGWLAKRWKKPRDPGLFR